MLGKTRFGGIKTGKNPTDRRKKESRKLLLTDGDGGTRWWVVERTLQWFIRQVPSDARVRPRSRDDGEDDADDADPS